MLTESCLGCGADVPLSGAVHILVNPTGDEDVTDGYLCRSCFGDHVEPLLPDDPSEDTGDDEGAGDGRSEPTEDGNPESAEDGDEPPEPEDPDDRPLEEA